MRLREPLVVPFAFIAAGIALAHYQSVPLPTAAILAAVFSLCALLLRPLRILSLASACFCCGLVLRAAHPLPPPPNLSVPDNAAAIFSGCVVEPGLTGEDRERFTLELAPHARAQVSLYAGKSDVGAGEDFPALPYGIEVELEGKARRPRNFRNPGAFDNEQYLARRSIYWTLSANAGKVRPTGKTCGDAFHRALFTLRGAALDRLDRLYPPTTPSGLYTDAMMQAVLIGVTSKLDRLWTEDYRRTGTYHALVISGSHIAVIAGVLLFFLRILGTPRVIALFAGILVAWLYAGIAGFEAPVVRSAAGMSMFGLGSLFYRKARLLNLVAAVALFFVLADPEALFDPSFQLSVLAVALIGVFAAPAIDATSGPLAAGLTDLPNLRRDPNFPPRVAQFRIEMRLLAQTFLIWMPRCPRRLAHFAVILPVRVAFYVWEIFLTSCFIQIGLALPSIVFFHRLPASGLTANVIVVPALSAVVPVGFAAIILNSAWLAAIARWFLAISQWAASLHARWEPDWRIPQPPLWLAVLFSLALILAATRFRPRWPGIAAWLIAALSLALLVLYPFPPAFPKARFELTAIDVAQGDSLLAAFPHGELMLIDAGGIPSFGRAHKSALDIGEDVVSPWLWTRSVKRLDVVAMTHAHTDHMGGMLAILRNFRPRELWTGATTDGPDWIAVRDTARQLGIAIRPLRRGEPFDYGGTQIQVLAPSPAYQPRPAPHNNDSLVMRLQYGATSFLLTGDMEKDIERQIAPLLQHTDVLKVGHHGSRTSTAPVLLEAATPSIAVISAGFENSYGHPHPQTLRALSERGIAIFRTDESGLVELISDGKTIHAANLPMPAVASTPPPAVETAELAPPPPSNPLPSQQPDLQKLSQQDVSPQGQQQEEPVKPRKRRHAKRRGKG